MKVPVVASLVEEMIIGLADEPISPAVAMRDMVPAVMVLPEILVSVVREKEKVDDAIEPLLVQVPVPLNATVHDEMSLLSVGATVVISTVFPTEVT